MAKAGLLDHRKFKKLVYLLGEPVPYCVGFLECLWIVAYQNRNALLGDAIDVALAAQYPGDPPTITNALHQAGFVDLIDGRYYVHDLYEHAPDYVKKFMKRHEAGQSPPMSDNGGQCPAREDKGREDKKEPPNPLEGGGEAKKKPRKPRKKPPEIDPLTLPLPAVLDNDAFRRSWSEWINYRRGRRFPNRPETLAKQLEFLASFGSRAGERIDESIRNGWQGLFAPKPVPGLRPEPQTPLYPSQAELAERAKRLAQEALERRAD